MPNPTNPDEAECRHCLDTGYLPGSDRRCGYCSWVETDKALTLGHRFAAQLSVIDGAPTKVCGIKVFRDGSTALCHKREEEH